MARWECSDQWPIGRKLLAIACALLMLPGISAAGELAKPVDEVVLSVEGKVGKRNSETGAQLDIAMLEEIGFVTKRIATDWTQNAVYKGVPGRAFVEHLAISDEYLLAIAQNDYEVSIPLADLIKYDTLFAIAKNGTRLSIKNKGPIWLVYETGKRPPISPEVLKSRMIWQLPTLVSK